jgi:hypothetical protein
MMSFKNTMAELERWRDVAENNGPIFRKEGNDAEADLCAEVVKEYSAAIAVLREAEKIGSGHGHERDAHGTAENVAKKGV